MQAGNQDIQILEFGVVLRREKHKNGFSQDTIKSVTKSGIPEHEGARILRLWLEMLEEKQFTEFKNNFYNTL